MKHPRLVLTLAVAVLLLTALWSWGHLVAAQRRAQAAAADLSASQRFAMQIEMLRQKPAIGASAQPHLELSRRIDQAASVAQLSAGGLERIGPEQQRRLSDSTIERSRQVYLRQLTMQQLVRFLHLLSAENPGLQVTSLRLTAPRGEEAGEFWRAEVTLTYWLHSTGSADMVAGAE